MAAHLWLVLAALLATLEARPATSGALHRCIARFSSLPPSRQRNWRAINAQPETQRLIEAAGGLTPLMKTFMRIYEKGHWGVGSGEGSSPKFAAKTACLLAMAIIPLLEIDVLLDFPCGDQQWAPALRKMLHDKVGYIGVDAMPGLVTHNRLTHGNPRTEFFLGDMGDPQVLGEFFRVWARVLVRAHTCAWNFQRCCSFCHLFF